MVEQLWQTPGHIQDKRILLDVEDGKTPPLLVLDALAGNIQFIDNIWWLLLKSAIIRPHPLTYKDKWEIKLIRHRDNLYIPLKAPLQLFYTMGQLRKLHKQFTHPSVTKLYKLLKSSWLQIFTGKTIQRLEHIISTRVVTGSVLLLYLIVVREPALCLCTGLCKLWKCYAYA